MFTIDSNKFKKESLGDNVSGKKKKKSKYKSARDIIVNGDAQGGEAGLDKGCSKKLKKAVDVVPDLNKAKVRTVNGVKYYAEGKHAGKKVGSIRGKEKSGKGDWKKHETIYGGTTHYFNRNHADGENYKVGRANSVKVHEGKKGQSHTVEVTDGYKSELVGSHDNIKDAKKMAENFHSHVKKNGEGDKSLWEHSSSFRKERKNKASRERAKKIDKLHGSDKSKSTYLDRFTKPEKHLSKREKAENKKDQDKKSKKTNIEKIHEKHSGKEQKGKVLWWSDRDKNGIIKHPDGHEVYIDHSVTDGKDIKSGSDVKFHFNEKIKDTLAGHKVKELKKGMDMDNTNLAKAITEGLVNEIPDLNKAKVKTVNGVKTYIDGPNAGKRVGSVRGRGSKKEVKHKKEFSWPENKDGDTLEVGEHLKERIKKNFSGNDLHELVHGVKVKTNGEIKGEMSGGLAHRYDQSEKISVAIKNKANNTFSADVKHGEVKESWLKKNGFSLKNNGTYTNNNGVEIDVNIDHPSYEHINFTHVSGPRKEARAIFDKLIGGGAESLKDINLHARVVKKPRKNKKVQKKELKEYKKKLAKSITSGLLDEIPDLNKGPKLDAKKEEISLIEGLNHHLCRARWKKNDIKRHEDMSKKLPQAKDAQKKHIEMAKKYAKKLNIPEKEVMDEIEGRTDLVERVEESQFNSHYADRKLS